MVVVTNHELRKKLAEVQLQSRIGIRGLTSGSGKAGSDSAEPVYLEEKRITRVRGDEMITADGTRGKLFSPVPGVKWRCLGTANDKGLIILEKELNGLFVTDGTNSYCIGVWGNTTEFEVILNIGANEIRLNDLFVNVKTKMLVKNGLEDNI